MLKFAAKLDDGGTLFGFGLSEANLNRLEFNRESLLFDFTYVGYPDLYGLILYLDVATPEALAADLTPLHAAVAEFIDPEFGVTVETLRVFPLTRSVMAKFRETPYWGYDVKLEIWQPNDRQIFFSGRTEEDIKQYLEASGIFGPPKRSPKGFGK